jgi:hypothetical protein
MAGLAGRALAIGGHGGRRILLLASLIIVVAITGVPEAP